MERFLAVLSSFAVFMSLMVMFAPAALAHHPEITANQTCVDQKVRIAYQAISWKTDGTPGSGHSDIRIEVRVGGAGAWTQVDSGAFNAANNYRFSDTFDAEPYWGSSIEVRARAVGPWDNGIGGGETRVTGAIQVSEDCFNPSCPDQYYEHKVEPVTAGAHGTYFTISNIVDGGSGPTFDWSSTRPVFQVIVKGGPGANIYDYPGGDTADTGLHAPLNPNNGKWYGLSHITFCYGDPVPEPVDVTPNLEVCELIQGVPTGAVSFGIDPTSGATVQVYADAGHNSPVGGPLGDGDSLPLAPGTYYWQATAEDGYTLSGPASGQFTIEPCSVSTVVVSGACAVGEDDVPLGTVNVSIDPDSGATVVITGPGGPYNFDGVGGSVQVPPGAYSWTATPGSGFALSGPGSGQFSVDPCEGSVAVTGGVCELLDGPLGVVEIDIDPDTAAVVTIYSNPGMTDVVASFDDEAPTTLPPGTYYWAAVAQPGFALEGDTSGQFTIDPCQASVTLVSGDCVIGDAGQPVGLVEVTITPESGATVSITGPGGPYLFTGTGGSEQLSPGSYSWSASAAGGFDLTGEVEGQFTIEPCDAAVLVAAGQCELSDGPQGSVTVFIDVDSGATVTVYDGESNVVAAFIGTGGSSPLPPGTYTWLAEPGDGFEFGEGQATAGEFTIDPCLGTVVVGHGNCVTGSASAFGSVDVSIDPAAAATVSIRNSNGQVVAVFTGLGGSQSLAAGDYTWVADPMPGFAVSGVSQGAFTVEPCPDEVEGEELEPDDEIEDVETLPFTGMASDQLFGAAVILLGTGWILIRAARKREED